STYGRPHFRFGDPDSTVEAIARWCRLALDSRATPVLLCHALGKTEEVMLALAPYGFEFALEKRCAPCARDYAAAGRSLPSWVELDGEPAPGRVVIAPPSGKDEIRRLGRYRTALVSGWAKDADFARLFGADATFDLSDHCDLDRRRKLERLVFDFGPEAAPVNVDGHLGDRAPIQRPSLGVGDGKPFGQVIEQLQRFVALDQRRVTEHASLIDGQSRGGTDW